MGEAETLVYKLGVNTLNNHQLFQGRREAAKSLTSPISC